MFDADDTPGYLHDAYRAACVFRRSRPGIPI